MPTRRELCRGAAGMLSMALGMTQIPLPAFSAPHPVYTPPVLPPPNLPGLVVLFSGKKEEIKQNWMMRGSHTDSVWQYHKGAMISTQGDMISKEKFTDIRLHVEFWEPYEPNNHGQDRSNSGVAPYGLYEIQVLDSYGIASPGSGDCGAVYSQSAPLFNACKPPLQWETYDIIFRAPRWDASGHKTDNARVTVLLNGICVQNNTVIPGPTGINYGRPEHPGPGPLLLQYHGHPVQFRNVWLQELPPAGANHY